MNKEPQRLRINQWGVDNSFATTHKDEIRLGKGGVDDAEDAEVILHEYGHAIHFAQEFAFASNEAGAISEGFGDYWLHYPENLVGQVHADGRIWSRALVCGGPARGRHRQPFTGRFIFGRIVSESGIEGKRGG